MTPAASPATDERAEWCPASQSLLAANAYQGHEGVRQFWEDLLSAWDEYQVEPEEFVDLDDRVVVVQRIRARSGRGIEVTSTGQASCAAVESRVAQEFRVRDELIVRVKVHRDRASALEALGLAD